MFEAEMEVVDVKPRKLRNGNKLAITLEVPYTEEIHADASRLFDKFMLVSMKEIQLPLDIEETG